MKIAFFTDDENLRCWWFAGLQELLEPRVIKALGNAFMAAQLGDAELAAQAVQNDAYLLFG